MHLLAYICQACETITMTLRNGHVVAKELFARTRACTFFCLQARPRQHGAAAALSPREPAQPSNIGTVGGTAGCPQRCRASNETLLNLGRHSLRHARPLVWRIVCCTKLFTSSQSPDHIQAEPAPSCSPTPSERASAAVKHWGCRWGSWLPTTRPGSKRNLNG